eukprot:5588816-Pleurochrysis_carterae.AAC.1
MEEGEVDESRPSLSPDEARYVREVAAKVASAESLRAERECTSVGAIASCRVELSIDEAMALYPASCMRLAEDEEATKEGVLEPLLEAGEDPPPTTLVVVEEILTASDVYAQSVLGKKAARARDQLLMESMDPHQWLKEELDLDMSLPDKAQLHREWRGIAFPLFTSGKEFLLGQVPESEDRREWRASPPDWPTEFTTPFPALYILPSEAERLTNQAERVTAEEHFLRR